MWNWFLVRINWWLLNIKFVYDFNVTWHLLSKSFENTCSMKTACKNSLKKPVVSNWHDTQEKSCYQWGC